MKKKYLQKLMIIAVPIMLSNIISQVQMIIDRIFLGQMNTLYMSALGNVTAPMWTTMSFCFTIVMGASILISQSVGAGDDEKVESYAASLIKWNNILPILLFFFWLFCGEYVLRAMGVSEDIMPMCLGYMRFFAPTFLVVGIESSFSVIMQTSNYTKPLVFYGIIRAGLNILLDWVLIFGRFGLPELGIEGAAIATTIAEYGGCLFAFIVITNKPLKTKPSPKSIITAPVKPFLSSVGLGINAGLEDFAWNMGNLIIIRILNSIDVKAAGRYSIVFSVDFVVAFYAAIVAEGPGAGETLLDEQAQTVAQGIETHTIHNVGHERLHKEHPGIFFRNASCTHIEKCVLVELSNCGAVAALHVVGIDFELWFGMHLGIWRCDNIVVALIRFSLVGTLEHKDFTFKSAL